MASDSATAQQVDVLITVFAKPYQTALSILSLLRHSGGHIDRIYFQEEPCTPDFEIRDHARLLRHISDRLVHFVPKYWLGTETTDEQRLKTDPDYRLSMRYQHGWEHTDKNYALVIHNDIEVTGDIAGALLAAINGATAVGEIGQCWWCPAGQAGLCSSERYTEFRPKYHQLMYMYNKEMDYKKRRAYNLGLRSEFWSNPWPLPECRVNEWCMLVDMREARPATIPFGSAAPLGSVYASGAKIGENWDEDVNLDTGVQWFRDLNHQGHAFRHYPVECHIVHDKNGHAALSSAELYVLNELRAKNRLKELYPEFSLEP